MTKQGEYAILEPNKSPEEGVHMIRVEILEQNRAALRPFVMLPFQLYKEDPNWVAPLISDQMRLLCQGQNARGESSPQAFSCQVAMSPLSIAIVTTSYQ